MSKKVAETPMMSQFYQFKRKYPNAILLFRVGDFYETFGDDAVEASAILGITLTKRSNGGSADTPLAGFPYHALDTYLPKLVRHGKRVAICDQIEDPKLAKKLVKRAVTEVVTPGLTMNDNVLDAGSNNFLACLTLGGGKAGVALLDLSTGEFATSEGSPEEIDKLLCNFQPKEVLVRRGLEHEIKECFGEQLHLYPLEEWVFTEDYGRGRLVKHFEVQHLKGFGIEASPLSIITAGAILYYLEATHHSELKHITTLRRIEENKFVQLDRFTLRNLELLQPLAEGGQSLLQTLNQTETPMGSRLLKRWLVFPLLDLKTIQERQRVVAAFLQDPHGRAELTQLLGGIGDLERLAGKVAVGRVNPRELRQIATALRSTEPIMSRLTASSEKAVQELGLALDPCRELSSRIEQDIDEETPTQLSKGRVIAQGVHPQLDELRQILSGGKEYLMQMRQRESEATGIPSLKIAFNNVFGYYIEVRNTHKDKVPEHWIRKQTLVSAERYITPELKEYEQKILGAEDRIQALEAELYQKLMAYVLTYISTLQQNATKLAEIDVLLSFADTAEAYNYHQPVVDSSDVLEIKAGRHPVIERLMPPGESYVPNDIYLDTETQQIIIITGPNMSGKSALLRQTALITLMALIGSFVPAEAARIGVVDRIFTRVGASDNISRGESTFMVEMTESAAILNGLTGKSLILIDELGRGTSTYDGISLAQAIVEYLHDHPRGRAKTLFATHYHELNELEGNFERVKNYNVSVQEQEGKVIFLRKLVRGGSEHSFGIHVAKLAGMPKEVIRRSEEILRDLEGSRVHTPLPQGAKPAKSREEKGELPMQLSFFQLDDPMLEQIRDEIVGIDINGLTPLEALNRLSSIQRLLTGGKEGRQ